MFFFNEKNSHEKDVQELENQVSSDTCLQDFNWYKPLILQVDASKRELGAVLIQKESEDKNKQVAYASKRLTQLKLGVLI